MDSQATERLARIEQILRDAERMVLPRIDDLSKKVDKLLQEQAVVATKVKVLGAVAGTVTATVVSSLTVIVQLVFG